MSRQQHQEEEEEEEEMEEIDIDSIEDEQTLIQLLDEAEDFDERKRIRDRLREVQFVIKAQREKDRRRREDEREQAIRDRLKAADEKKKQTLAMYDQMAKAGPPETRRSLNAPAADGMPRDVTEEAIRGRVKAADERKKRIMAVYDHAAKSQPTGDARIFDYDAFNENSRSDSPARGPDGKRRDLVEEAIRDRVKAADDRKKRIMAAYDHAAKSQPAGQARIVEFDTFKSADVSKLEAPKPVKGSCCFSMSGGIPKVEKVASVAIPKSPPVDESHLDPMERAIRARVREAEERKRRTLAAYDMAAKSGPGPKTVILEEYRDIDVSSQSKQAPRYDPCFRGVKT